MRLRAEVHCYHCGRLSGTWEWLSATSTEYGLFREPGAGDLLPGALRQLRCLHCGGPVFLDEITRIRPPATLQFERPRRGRPRKHDGRLVS